MKLSFTNNMSEVEPYAWMHIRYDIEYGYIELCKSNELGAQSTVGCTSESALTAAAPSSTTATKEESAADSASLSAVTDETRPKCPICFCDFQDPKKLPCNHEFCSGCLKDCVEYLVDTGKTATRSGVPINCPLCRGSTRVSVLSTVNSDTQTMNYRFNNVWKRLVRRGWKQIPGKGLDTFWYVPGDHRSARVMEAIGDQEKLRKLVRNRDYFADQDAVLDYWANASPEWQAAPSHHLIYPEVWQALGLKESADVLVEAVVGDIVDTLHDHGCKDDDDFDSIKDIWRKRTSTEVPERTVVVTTGRRHKEPERFVAGNATMDNQKRKQMQMQQGQGHGQPRAASSSSVSVSASSSGAPPLKKKRRAPSGREGDREGEGNEAGDSRVDDSSGSSSGSGSDSGSSSESSSSSDEDEIVYQYTTQRDNERPDEIAAHTGIDVSTLIRLNAKRHQGMKPTSRLMIGTNVIVGKRGKGTMEDKGQGGSHTSADESKSESESESESQSDSDSE
eukprot:g1060.t1